MRFARVINAMSAWVGTSLLLLVSRPAGVMVGMFYMMALIAVTIRGEQE